jgi:(p)ppGpp synthase/HD superfamily hydrolase
LGLENLEYRLGGCCGLWPGALIAGILAFENNGITIHRQACGNQHQVPGERRLPARLDSAADEEQRHRYPAPFALSCSIGWGC